MKKKLLLLLMFISLFTFGGCSIFYNDIYNNSYNATFNLNDLEELTIAISKNISPSVIEVNAYSRTGLTESVSLGSAVVYSCSAKMKDGSVIKNPPSTLNSENIITYQYYAVTNKHVIESANTIKVYIGQTDERINAQVTGTDNKVDLAVVYFEYEAYIAPLAFADSDNVEKGSFALAIGNPEGYYGTITFGIISHTKRYMSEDTDNDGRSDWDAEYIQHDVAINPGNSGGALINLEGKVIGINTLKLIDSEAKIDNMGFAIPSNIVAELIPYLEKGEIPKRVTMGLTALFVKDYLESLGNGIDTYNIPKDIKYGALVQEFTEQSSVFYGKILVNDIILTFNNVDVKHSYHLRTELNKLIIGSGEMVEIVVYRNGKIETIKFSI